MGGLLWNTAALSTESSQPPYGPAPAPLDGPELPSFRYQLGAQKTEQFNGGTAKEANVTGFPVSEKLAGVYMTLEPGALRELHWHANAAEWAYVIEGNCRVTTIDPAGQCEIVDFGPGDVWYFPRGHGHSIQGIGPGTCVFLLVFDNGYFSEFGTFSISDWIGHTPPEVLARNFGVPASTFADFPKKEVYINTGPVPPPLPAEPAPGSLNEPPLTHRYRLLAAKPEQFAGGTLRRASASEFPISTTMTGALLIIEPGGMRELHWHPHAAEWQYYIRGSAQMTVFGSHGRARTDAVRCGRCRLRAAGLRALHREHRAATSWRSIAVFNNGSYELISITGWMAANPDLLLATNFEVPESVFAKFPKGAVIMPEQG